MHDVARWGGGGFSEEGPLVLSRSRVTFACVAVWIVGAALLFSSLLQMQGYAAIINNAGTVRGGTQMAVKLELAGTQADDLEAHVDGLLSQLIADEEARPLKSSATREVVEGLHAVQAKWREVEQGIAEVRAGAPGDALMRASQEHWDLADRAVRAAEARANGESRLMLLVSALLVLFTTALLVLRERDSMRRLRKTFLIDPLTGGSNLEGFYREASKAIAGAPPSTYLVVYTNVVHFRFINDSFGRAAGDELIVRLYGIYRSLCDGLCARADSDHFALLVKNDPAALERLCEKVDADLREAEDLHFTGTLSCNYGAYVADDPNVGVASMVSDAALVLKAGVKERGVAYYTEAFRAKLSGEMEIVQGMGDALARDEFLMYLQPQVDVRTGRLTGAECLCRWKSDKLGLLQPTAFIPALERSGLISDLDFHMLERVCRAYPLPLPGGEGAPLPISVNFSRPTVLQDGFVERFLEIVSRYDLPPEAIEVEVTEGAFMVDEAVVVRTLETLSADGFRIAMDDFGSGFSSLNLLRRLPIHVLKLDKEFLREGYETDRTQSILSDIVVMAQHLGIRTVCEGVETPEHVALLREIGCDTAQGFYYSRPLDLDAFRKKYLSQP